MATTLTVWKYHTPEGAEEALGVLEQLKKEQLIEIHDAAVRRLTQGLVELGVLSGEVDELVARDAHRPFYMHQTSHWLGLDVHDVGTYRQDGAPRRLEPGMVFTVEPGLYFAPGQPGVPERLQGIGVRIEDDVAVGAEGCEVLTAAIPKAPDELEALVSEG